MSVTVQVTTVVPTGNWDGASLTTLAMPQLSDTVGGPRSTPEVEHWPGSALTVSFAGQAIAGFSVSATVTICWQVVLHGPSEVIRLNVNEPGPVALTVTLALVASPSIAPSPLINQLKAGFAALVVAI